MFISGTQVVFLSEGLERAPKNGRDKWANTVIIMLSRFLQELKSYIIRTISMKFCQLIIVEAIII
jgi:hypothetical protein